MRREETGLLQQRKGLRKHLSLQMPFYIFVIVLFLTGSLFGILLSGALSAEQQQVLASRLQSFLNMNSAHSMDLRTEMLHTFLFEMKWIGLIWFVGLSVIGMPLIFMLDFAKGMLVGFTVGCLAGQFSWKSILIIMTSVVPQNLLIIPAIVAGSVASIIFSSYLLKHRFLNRNGSLLRPFVQYSGLSLLLSIMMLAASYIETYVSPLLLHLAMPMF